MTKNNYHGCPTYGSVYDALSDMGFQFDDNGNLLTSESYSDFMISMVDTTDPNNIYIGYALPGTATSADEWQIKRISTSNSITSTLFANGAANFINVWNNRVSLGYS